MSVNRAVGRWIKSSRSVDACVEISVIDGSAAGAIPEAGAAHKAGYDHLIVMRDSKNPDGPKLYFTPAEWEAFRLGVLDGEFDDLAE